MSTITSTPYDDVFKTLLNDCTKLIITMINKSSVKIIQMMKQSLIPITSILYISQIRLQKRKLQIPVLQYTTRSTKIIILNVRVHPMEAWLCVCLNTILRLLSITEAAKRLNMDVSELEKHL